MLATPRWYAEGPEALVVSLARRGDTLAFTELVRRREDWLRRLLRGRCEDPALADDVARRVFLRAARRIRRLSQPERFEAWLRRMALDESGRRCPGQAAAAGRDNAVTGPAPTTSDDRPAAGDDGFGSDVVERVRARRRRVLLGRLGIAAALIALEVLLDSPVQDTVGSLSELLATPLVSIGPTWLDTLLGPLNSPAGLVALLLLGLQFLYRRFFC